MTYGFCQEQYFSLSSPSLKKSTFKTFVVDKKNKSLTKKNVHSCCLLFLFTFLIFIVTKCWLGDLVCTLRTRSSSPSHHKVFSSFYQETEMSKQMLTTLYCTDELEPVDTTSNKCLMDRFELFQVCHKTVRLLRLHGSSRWCLLDVTAESRLWLSVWHTKWISGSRMKVHCQLLIPTVLCLYLILLPCCTDVSFLLVSHLWIFGSLCL